MIIITDKTIKNWQKGWISNIISMGFGDRCSWVCLLTLPLHFGVFWQHIYLFLNLYTIKFTLFGDQSDLWVWRNAKRGLTTTTIQSRYLKVLLPLNTVLFPCSQCLSHTLATSDLLSTGLCNFPFSKMSLKLNHTSSSLWFLWLIKTHYQ